MSVAFGIEHTCMNKTVSFDWSSVNVHIHVLAHSYFSALGYIREICAFIN